MFEWLFFTRPASKRKATVEYDKLKHHYFQLDDEDVVMDSLLGEQQPLLDKSWNSTPVIEKTDANHDFPEYLLKPRQNPFFEWHNLLKTSILILLSFLVIIMLVVIPLKLHHQGDMINSTDSTFLDGLTAPSSTENNQMIIPTFTLRRVGYDALTYFNPIEADNHLQYVFLEDYSAIIEPSGPMELYFYDLSPSSTSSSSSSSNLIDGSISYEYTICPNDVTTIPKAHTQSRTGHSSTSSFCVQGEMYYNTTTGSTTITSVIIDCTARSTYTITVSAITSSTQQTISTQSVQAICLYVRREIRALTSADLNAFLDASYTLHTLSQEDGTTLYGTDNYYSALSLAKLHYFNAAQRDGDHLHDGNGFLLQHVKLQSYFAKSIQSINPAVISPYWDFTIDHSEGKNAFNNFLSSADLYGTVTYPNGDLHAFNDDTNIVEDARISNGRWKDIKQHNNTYFPDLYAGYGYMRAPWVFNPSPYVSRYAYDWGENGIKQAILPSCEKHYNILTMTNELMNFFNDMTYNPHIASHTSYGGMYGCNTISSWLTIGLVKNVTMQEKICTSINAKDLYREGLINVQKNCSLTFTPITTPNTAPTHGSAGTASTHPAASHDRMNEGSKHNEHKVQSSASASTSLSMTTTTSSCGYICRDSASIASSVEAFYELIAGYLNPDTTLTKTEIFTIFEEFICNHDGSLHDSMADVFVGEHYESASITDPTFWVLHPTLERLFHAKLLSGGFNDETWANDTINDFVCLMSPCYNEATDITDYFPDCCYGHFADDRMYDGFQGTRAGYVGLSNRETLSVSDPRYSSTYQLDYIYDNFQWKHCAEDGYDINVMLKELYEEYLTVHELDDALTFYRYSSVKKGRDSADHHDVTGTDMVNLSPRDKLRSFKRFADKPSISANTKSNRMTLRQYEKEVITRIKGFVERNKKRYRKAKELERIRNNVNGK